MSRTARAKTPVQARGARRVERLLQAAAAEIAEVGVGAMTMNAVAIRAQTSPGSLYQFFPAKPALLGALAERYAAELRAISAEAAQAAKEAPGLRPEAVVAAFLRPFVRFYRANPAYAELYAALNRPGDPTQLEVSLDAAIAEGLTDVLAIAARADARRLRTAATVMIEASHGVLSSLGGLDVSTAAAVETELHVMLAAYAATLTRGDAAPP